MQLNPQQMKGVWDEGYTLDRHVESSEYIGEDEHGNPQFETTRTELGELLFQLKYRSDVTAVEPIATAAAGFIRTWQRRIDFIVPVPPSRSRAIQPLFQVADALGRLLKLPVDRRTLRKTRNTLQLKNVDPDKRLEILVGAHALHGSALKGRCILLLDDLYQSGATLNAVAQVLKDGGASAVFVLALTRARR